MVAVVLFRLTPQLWRCVALFCRRETLSLRLVNKGDQWATLPCPCWLRAVHCLTTCRDATVRFHGKSNCSEPHRPLYVLSITLPAAYDVCNQWSCIGAVKLRCHMCCCSWRVRSRCDDLRKFYRFVSKDTGPRVYICVDCLVACYMETAPCTQRRQTGEVPLQRLCVSKHVSVLVGCVHC